MSAKGKKVAVVGITFESNSFAPGLTEIDAFNRYLMVSGPEVLTAGLGKDEIAGAHSVADQEGILLVPVFVADGGCGPTVSDSTYTYLKGRLIEELEKVINQVDGVYLRLHGAMTTESIEDVEGDLINEVRKMTHPDFPIAVSCDFHAHFTEKMATGTDLISGYQTCPHIDFYETGARAMKLMAAALSNPKKPTLAYRKVKMIGPAEGHDTKVGPMREVLDRLHEIEKLPGVLDATVYCTQPWLEVSELGWSAVVVTDGDQNLAQKYADELAAMMWERRERILYKKTELADALKEVSLSSDSERPFIFADGSDSPSAGSTGDSAFLLKYLLENKIDELVYMSVTDAQAAADCFAAGVGAEVSVKIGGTLSPRFFTSVPAKGTVVTLCDGIYQSKYPSKIFNAGPTAVLRIGKIHVVITTKPAFMLDYQLYLRVGLDITVAKIVQAKSAGAYRAFYQPLAFACIDFAAPGASDSRLELMPFTRPKRPLWPLDRDIEDPWYS